MASGRVVYKSNSTSNWLSSRFKSGRLKCIVDYFGINYFTYVVEVDLIRVGSDPLMAHVGRLAKLETLYLSRSSVHSAGLKHLEALAHLKYLALDGTKITDDGLAYLNGLTGLKELYLGETNITDSGLAHIQSLSKLEHLFWRKRE